MVEVWVATQSQQSEARLQVVGPHTGMQLLVGEGGGGREGGRREGRGDERGKDGETEREHERQGGKGTTH